YKERVSVKSYVGDIVDIASVKSAFSGVDCVIHCAALVSYQFPPDYEALNTANVTGTKNVVSLCLEMCVPRLGFHKYSGSHTYALFWEYVLGHFQPDREDSSAS
ncbi:hypothetical protein L9F63_021755, partial [Diploptera punctata]